MSEEENVITIPYKFTPRVYQRQLLEAMDIGYKRALCIYHRRAGKDKTMFNVAVKKAFERVGVYYYFFPEFAQGRRVIWDGIDGSGMKFLDHIPECVIQSKNSTDMKIVLTNGSVIQVMGTDKFDKVRGSNPVGCVFSEYAFQNPKAWNTVRPILVENGGWAIFNSSTNGKNHLWEMYNMALKNKFWFVQNLNVLDTLDEEGNRYVKDDVIEEERAAGMSEEMIQQEFYNSFTANAQGFYYLEYIEDAEKEKRITSVPHDPSARVSTYWDLGVGDATSIWFVQTEGKNVNIIDYYSASTKGLDHYARVLQNKKYVYESHNFPHDIGNIEFGTGRTRYEVAAELFKGTRLNVLSKLRIEEGINAARMILPYCRFDKVKCAAGLDGLRNYRREFDEKNQVYRDLPLHDWASNPADAFRYLAIGIALPKSRSFRSEIITDPRRLIKARNTNWRTC